MSKDPLTSQSILSRIQEVFHKYSWRFIEDDGRDLAIKIMNDRNVFCVIGIDSKNNAIRFYDTMAAFKSCTHQSSQYFNSTKVTMEHLINESERMIGRKIRQDIDSILLSS